ncbi:hypothetical protein EUX98_g6993 [Antrodiella citrinella]|uniref:C2 domain-containing protein n=1 Tax=Antrodiella citrinella TaxID=2447956 RepID=A0A4S4MMM5_9APHY|nr:hypothetical protein EUX98_g6993 [Antrodiella citrinella]
MSHKFPEPYSGKNPVPQIATKLTSLLNPERATEATAEQLQDQSGQNDQKQTEKRASKLAKGRVMRVTDPTTGEELDIRNADDEPDTRNQGDNVLDTDFPPPDWAAHKSHVITVTYQSIVIIATSYITFPILVHLFSASSYALLLSLIPPSLLTYVLVFRLRNVSRGDFEDRVWHSERMRGLRAGSDVDGDGKVTDEERTKESAEWANALLRGVWPVLNPDLFSSVVDMLEDIMQSSVPHFIHSVRISDLGLGRNAARITAIRSLPDAETRASNKSKAQSGEVASLAPAGEQQDKQDDSGSPDPFHDQQEELDGDHINVEVSFAYHGMPSGRSAASKAGNIHLSVEFFLGIQGVFGVRVPVWVEVTGAVGTARARLQLISDPPFVKTTMVSLMGLPRITISVIPLAKLLPNVMDLPFVSGFISSAIDTAVAEYVAPKSLTLDLQQLISGDDIKKDTEALGVLVVHIHRATDVKGMDANGSSADPYVTLTYSRLEKPLYSTRIIKEDRNPVFEETAVVMIDINTIRLRESLSLQLWDSDRMSVDDMLGVAEVSILDLVRQRGKPTRRISPLTGPNTHSRPGSVEYTVGYYGKLPPHTSCHEVQTDGADPSVPADLRAKPEFKEKRAVALNDLEAAVLMTPPDPQWPSGILSMQVHQIRDLEVRKEGRDIKSIALKGAGKKGVSVGREGEKGQDDVLKAEEEAEGLPSSYCEISLNDELVYKTRVKPITSSPMFNAGTERFVRDWRSSHVTVAVKDSRMRENDAILGVVMLKLSELFINASQITRFYSIEEGLGYGRIRISLLFRPVEAKLPPNLLGFDTGTLEIRDVSIKATQRQEGTDAEPALDLDLAKCELRMRTSKSEGSEKFSRQDAKRRDDGSVAWAHRTSTTTSENDDDDASCTMLPVRQRYGSALLLSFKDKRTSSGLKHSSVRHALAVLWLRDIADNVRGPVHIALWKAKDGDFSRLKLNYVPPDGNLDGWDSDQENVTRVGTVEMDLKFKPGISEKHRALLGGGGSAQKEAWDAFTREKVGGLRDAVGDVEVREDDAQSNGGRRQSVASGGKTGEMKKQEDGDGETTVVERNLSEIRTGTDGPVNSAAGDERAGSGPAQEGTNTVVSTDAVEDLSQDTSDRESAESSSNEGPSEKKGLKQRFKDWKANENELHRDHRGVMQMKPARTATWLKDNVEDGAHAIKERFSLRSRKPELETEV